MQSDFVNVTMLLTNDELKLIRILLNDKLASCQIVIDRLNPNSDIDLMRHIQKVSDQCDSILDQLPIPNRFV